MSAVDETTICVSGLAVHVYGLDKVINSRAISVDVVFLLHGRTGNVQHLAPMARAILKADYDGAGSPPIHGLLVVSFDHRNHGHRKVSDLSNMTWADGNELHASLSLTKCAEDSIQYGTSQDVSLLITFLPAFLFPQGNCAFANIICAGISLGGHSTYLVLSNDDRVAAGVVILGCPDYMALMTLRAGMEHGDKRLPQGFHDIVAKLDPRLENVSKKDLLILKGEIDELVPWSACQGFVSHLPPETTELVGFPDVGHAFPREMMKKSVDWIVEWRRRR